MIVLGLAGLAGSGKDTAADFLVRNHAFVKVAFADAIKRAAREWFDFSEVQLWGPSSERNKPDERYNGLTPRRVLQFMGTEIGRELYGDIWVEYALRVAERLNQGGHTYSATRGLNSFSLVGGMEVDVKEAFERSKRHVVISDVRFKNEVRLIKAFGGTVFRMRRGQGLDGVAGLHQSEQEMQQIPDEWFDGIIDNREWTLEQLERHMAQLVEGYNAC